MVKSHGCSSFFLYNSLREREREEWGLGGVQERYIEREYRKSKIDEKKLKIKVSKFQKILEMLSKRP